MVRCKLEILLQQAGITLDLKHPEHPRKHIEQALKQLQDDGVIGECGRIVEQTPEGQEREERIETLAYHWWQDYAHQLWVIHPPKSVKQACQALL